jgi:hypothetical protein
MNGGFSVIFWPFRKVLLRSQAGCIPCARPFDKYIAGYRLEHRGMRRCMVVGIGDFIRGVWFDKDV